MDEVVHIGFDVYFSKLPDPRISRKKLYPLIEETKAQRTGGPSLGPSSSFD